MKLNALSAGSSSAMRLMFSDRDILTAVENAPGFSIYLEAVKNAVIANQKVKDAIEDDAMSEDEFGRLLDVCSSIEDRAESEGERLMETEEVEHLIENPNQNEHLGWYPIIGWHLPENNDGAPKPITLMNEYQFSQGYYEVRSSNLKLIYYGNTYNPLTHANIYNAISYFLTYRIWQENKLNELGIQTAKVRSDGCTV